MAAKYLCTAIFENIAINKNKISFNIYCSVRVPNNNTLNLI